SIALGLFMTDQNLVKEKAPLRGLCNLVIFYPLSLTSSWLQPDLPHCSAGLLLGTNTRLVHIVDPSFEGILIALLFKLFELSREGGASCHVTSPLPWSGGRSTKLHEKRTLLE